MVQSEGKDHVLYILCDHNRWATHLDALVVKEPSSDTSTPLTSFTIGQRPTPVYTLHTPPQPLCLLMMDSPDAFLSNVAQYAGPPDLFHHIYCDADSEQYLYSTVFTPSSSESTTDTPSLQSSSSEKTHKGAEKRIRKKAPKLEHCSKAQVTVRTFLLILRRA